MVVVYHCNLLKIQGDYCEDEIHSHKRTKVK